MKSLSRLVIASAALLSLVSTAEAQSARRKPDGARSEQTADILSGALGAASGFGKGRWTTGVGYAGSAVPIVFALGTIAEVDAYCERARTRTHVRECTRLKREADERLGMSILYATPVGDLKEVVEGLEKGDPKRVVCGGIGLASLASPARGLSVAGGVCSVFDTMEAVSRGPTLARARFDAGAVFHSDRP